MGFLNPLFLLAGAVIAVPLILHLFRRRELRRIPFPALRYLLRATRDHARTIRIRQWLLLILRIAVCLLLVLAGSRLHLWGARGAHRPTALAIVLDNSLSSGLVEGETRVLDRLKARALETVEEAGPEDRIWVLRAGEPWDVAVPGSASEARLRVSETEVSGGAGDLAATLARAGTLVSAAPQEESEIQLLSDLQATAFPGESPVLLPEDVRLLVYRPPPPSGENRYLREVLVGGGLAPMANQRAQIAVAVGASNERADTLAVRLMTGGRTIAATTVEAGSEALLEVGPFTGALSGYAEIDPDPLRADNRRYFSVPVRPPVRVSLQGEGSFFLEHAVEVLVHAGRARQVDGASAEVLVSAGGAGVGSRRPGSAVIVVPLSDGSVLPALNRELTLAGIPWRYESVAAPGETEVAESRLPVSFADIRVRRQYHLVSNGEEEGGEVQVTLASGAPWIVSGEAPGGPYLLLASPLEPEATTLAVAAPMLPLVEWMVARWPFRSTVQSLLVGDLLPADEEITAVALGGGRPEALHPGVPAVARAPGLYRLLAGDSVVRQVAVNPPQAESELEPIGDEALRARLGREYDSADSGSWRDSVFGNRQGAELWRWLLFSALLLLLVESRLAASGHRSRD